MTDVFTFNGKEYKVRDTISKGLSYKFISKNQLLKSSDLSYALGYSLTDILKYALKILVYYLVLFVASWVTATITIEASIAVLNSGGAITTEFMESYNNGLKAIVSYRLGIVLLATCLMFYIFHCVLAFIVAGYDVFLIRKDLEKVIAKRLPEMEALNREEEIFRTENNILKEVHWSKTQAEKRILLETILLNDVNASSPTKRRMNSKGKLVAMANPELEQYLIRNN